MRRTRRTSGEISPDVLSFNTVLRMLSGAGNAHAPLALLQCMASCGVCPRVSTYAIALASAAVAGDAAVVIEVWRCMSSLHVVPNIDCVNILLATLVLQVLPPFNPPCILHSTLLCIHPAFRFRPHFLSPISEFQCAAIPTTYYEP